MFLERLALRIVERRAVHFKCTVAVFQTDRNICPTGDLNVKLRWQFLFCNFLHHAFWSELLIDGITSVHPAVEIRAFALRTTERKDRCVPVNFDRQFFLANWTGESTDHVEVEL